MSTQPVSPARRLEVERAKFPSMNPAEILIWVEFLRLHEHEYDTLPQSWLDYRKTTLGAQPQPGDVFDYNVRLGAGRDPGAAFAQSVRDMAVMATQLRMDAVGFQGGVPVILEVEKNASAPQVGQLLTYASAWRNARVTASDPKMVLVYSDLNEGALDVIRETGITPVCVPVDFRQLSPYAPVALRSTTGS